MRIMYIIETLGIGGAEQALVNIAPGLRGNGNDVSVVVLRPPLTLGSGLEGAGIPVQILSRHNKWNLWSGARQIARIARQRDCDIVHAHLYFPSLYVALARLIFGLRARTAVTYHNLAYKPGVNRLGLRLRLRKAINRLATRAGIDRCFGVSSAVADHYRAALGLGEVEVIPNPIPIGEIDAVVGSSAGPERSASDRLRLVLPGRLVHEKGHGVLLEAVEHLDRGDTHYEIVFAGDGPMRPAIEAMIGELGLTDVVRITGLLDHADLIGAVAAADIVVIPSISEGFGMAAAEAMAARRPVVASRVGGLIDVVEDERTGLLVEPRDPVALAGAIDRLASDAALRGRMGEAGRSRVEREFDAPLVANRYLDAYRRMMSRDAKA